jgi:hypothetical protein
MPASPAPEQFVTLFNRMYLPMGLCLHASLLEHAQPFHLWIVCMDELVEEQLRRLSLPHVSLIPLREVETEALLAQKPHRTPVEYCWTLTPFTPTFVFERDNTAARVTYLDADVFFFASPRVLLEELDCSRKQVLITPHAYGPEYAHRAQDSGRYCVQFITIQRTEGGRKVIQWWQDRCLEWCFARMENGKFGDQKYLDDWPSRFPEEVHVLERVEKTLAPWNVRHFVERRQSDNPVLYHFHSLRLVSSTTVRLYLNYRVGRGRWVYDRYLKALRCALASMRQNGMPTPIAPQGESRWGGIKSWIRCRVLRVEEYADL